MPIRLAETPEDCVALRCNSALSMRWIKNDFRYAQPAECRLLRWSGDNFCILPRFQRLPRGAPFFLLREKGMILLVSRRTDIRCHYAEWFIERVRDGFVILPPSAGRPS